MKIYTKSGDDGQTGLFRGPRVRKDDLRIEAYGTVDELNAVLGMVGTETLPDTVRELLASVQHELFAVGAELATPDPVAGGMAWLTEEHITRLEQAIDHYEATLPPLSAFILPGGSRAAAGLHLARTVCRRAERRWVSLHQQSQQPTRVEVGIYLNRLSDLLFVLARAVNQAANVADIPWQKPAQ